MQQARMLGYRVEKIADSCNVSPLELSQVIGCDENQIKSLFKGRSFVSFEQLVLLSKTLNVNVSDFLSGYDADYNKSAVHCMNDFDDPNNREKILDIIDEYMDVLDSVSK